MAGHRQKIVDTRVFDELPYARRQELLRTNRGQVNPARYIGGMMLLAGAYRSGVGALRGATDYIIGALSDKAATGQFYFDRLGSDGMLATEGVGMAVIGVAGLWAAGYTNRMLAADQAERELAEAQNAASRAQASILPNPILPVEVGDRLMDPRHLLAQPLEST